MCAATDPGVERLEWVPIPPELDDGLATGSLTREQHNAWRLVLAAREIPFRSETGQGRRQLLVPPAHYRSACRELRHYERENRNWPPPPPVPRPLHENRAATLWVLILLAVFHNISAQQVNPLDGSQLDWTALGNAHAGKILAGEWWRLITALTLHAGPLHLIGNLVVGGLFMIRLGRLLGSGYAWLLVLLGGAGGNLLNALVQNPGHRSIGASTAVFAAVGLLASFNMLRYRTQLRQRWPLPLAAALGLLALLGSSGENTDIGAHLFGLCCGILLGLPAARWLLRRNDPPQSLNRLLALISLLLVVGAWWRALTA